MKDPDSFLTTGRNGNAANLVDALFAIADSIEALAKAVNRLGLNDASTPMGAIEFLVREVKNLSGNLYINSSNEVLTP